MKKQPMLKRCLLVVMLLTSLSVMSGCAWFVPGSIKREVSLVNVDLQTAIKEVEALSGDEAKQKALRTFKRVVPHVENINNYVQGRKANR